MILHTVTSWLCLTNRVLQKKNQYCLIIILKNKNIIFDYPSLNESIEHKGLQKVFIDVGIPSKIVGDPGGKFIGERWDSTLKRYHFVK